MNKIDYKRVGLSELYRYALIGAESCVEKNAEGNAQVNTVLKQLYIQTIIAARLLKIVDIEDDSIMSVNEFDKCKVSENNVGIGKTQFIADVKLFKDMLNDEIVNVLNRENDIMKRIDESIKQEITPERVEQLRKDIEEISSKIER